MSPGAAWSAPPSTPRLGRGQVAVWLLDGGVTRPLESILALYLGVDAASLTLERAQGGKPMLQGSALDASLSHGGDISLVAVVREGRVGVDVEPLRPGIEGWSLVRQVLTQRERVRLQALLPAERARAFLAAWTRKEALLKAAGVGLSVEPRLIEIGQQGQVVRVPAELGRPDDWTLVELTLAGHVAAVSVDGAVFRLELYDARATGLGRPEQRVATGLSALGPG